MTEYRATLPKRPRRVEALTLNDAGMPVPWFVEWIDGEPDFRVMDGRKLRAAITLDLCWMCGQPLGRYKAFVIGPMCAVNRTSAEPPNHRDCAVYAAMSCPFLTQPNRKRRERGMPDEAVEASGIAIKRNPGVALVWVSTNHKTWEPDSGGVLFDIGDPTEALWFCEGRPATHDEVMASIESGLPLLEAEADKDDRPAEARIALEAYVKRALAVVPA